MADAPPGAPAPAEPSAEPSAEPAAAPAAAAPTAAPRAAFVGLRRFLTACPLRWGCLAVFLLAAALRLEFVTRDHGLSESGDALFYARAGIRTWKGLAGEAIPVPTLWRIFLRGPAMSLVEGAVIAATSPEDLRIRHYPQTVPGRPFWLYLRILWSLVDAATCALIAAAAWTIYDRTAGLAAGLISATYPAMVILQQVPYPQTWVGAGLAAALLGLALGMPGARRRPLLLGGLAVGLAGQFAPTPIGLGLPLLFVPGLLYCAWGRSTGLRPALPILRWFGLGVAAVWAARFAVELAVLGPQMFENPIYESASETALWHVLDSGGWIPDAYMFELGQAPAKKLPSAFAVLSERPLRLTVMALWSAFRNWQYPANIFGLDYLTGFAGQTLWHQTLVLLALLVGPACLALRPAAALILSPILFLTAAYSLYLVHPRYLVPVLPFVAILLGDALARTVDAFMRGRFTRRNLASAAAGGALLFAVSTFLTPAVIAAGLPLPPESGILQATVAVIALAAAGLALLLRGWAAAWTGAAVWSWVGATLVAGAIALAVFGESAWHEWSTELRSAPGAGPRALQATLDLPDDGLPAGQVLLLIDADIPPGDPLELLVNDTPVGRVPRNDPSQDWQFVYFYGGKAAAGELRQWHAVPVPRALIAPGANRVRLQLAPSAGGAAVRIYGDYPDAFRAGNYSGPRIGFSQEGRSAFRLYWSKRDPRLDGTVRLGSRSSRAEALDETGWRADDLSAEAGRQWGALRVRLAVLPPPFTQPDPKLPDADLRLY
ncbi:MAG: hypothetical protein HZA54_09660 [Planctomycetes bacterium]|nr:hypothetical protein [Planctomycetota bacterium]